MEKVCIHCYVSGRVHGVWFRASTQARATELGATGWVRNLPDGRVEVMACGEASQVERLQTWLAQGPRLARVDHVEVNAVPWQEFQGFEIR